jgi:hypothetical protein
VTLVSGTNSIVAKDTDAASNAGTSSPVVFTLDTVAPTVSITTTGGLTNQASQTISGTVTDTGAAPGSTVTLYDNGSTTPLGTATLQANGSWSAPVTLVSGTNSIVAKDTDAAGNTGTSSPVVFTLDTVPPTVSITTTGGLTNQASQTISGTVTSTEATSGSTVTLYDNGSTTPLGTATLQANGSWSTPVTLVSGTNSIVAEDIDSAGNTGTSSPVVFTLDTVPPTVSITTTGGLTNQASQTISGTVTDTGAAPGSTVTLYDNGSATPLGTATLQSNGSWSTPVTLVNGTNSIVAKDTDAAGNTGTSSPVAFTLEASGPTVTSIVPSPNSGDLNTGASVTLMVTISENVMVTGTPVLMLNDGGTATYESDPGSNTLIFSYTVANAQNTPALAVTGNNLNGSTIAIVDASGNEANLSGADVTFPSLAIVATVSSISAAPSTGDLGPGNTVTFTVTTREPVKITGGTPFLVLNDGGEATYKSGSGTNVLTFTYKVGALGSDQNVASLAVTGFNPNGATVYDSNNTADTADLSGVTAFTSGPQIDTTAPTVTSVVATPANGDLDAGNTVTLIVTFSENVTVTGAPYLSLNDGGKANYTSGSGTNALTFIYMVASGQNTPDLAVTGAALNDGTIEDGAGNKAVFSGAVGSLTGTLQIDTTPPKILSIAASGPGITDGTGDLGPGSTVTLTVTFSEAVNVNTTDGTPSMALNDGGTATYTSGSGSDALVFTYTVGALGSGQNTSDLVLAANNAFALNGATITDEAGNAAVLTAANGHNLPGTLQIDTTAPTVTNVVSSPASGDVTTGHTVRITMDMSEKVNVTGSPVLLFNDGSQTIAATSRCLVSP